MLFEAKEWGDKTLVTCFGTPIFPKSQMVVDIPLKMFKEKCNKWKTNKELIQNVFPELSADQREFLISGCPIGHFTFNEIEENENEP